MIADALPGLASVKDTLGKDASSLAKGDAYDLGLRSAGWAGFQLYAQLKRDMDTRNAENQDRFQRAQLLSTGLDTATAFGNPEIIAAGQAEIWSVSSPPIRT